MAPAEPSFTGGDDPQKQLGLWSEFDGDPRARMAVELTAFPMCGEHGWMVRLMGDGIHIDLSVERTARLASSLLHAAGTAQFQRFRS